jgi:pimeloyl-ACP methyl ester carboxylesterase
MMLTTLLAAAAAFTSSFSSAPERELSAGDKGVLKGALLAPTTASRATMVIIPGSGPTNRDGNNALGPSGSYRQLAEALAQRGITTVRIDKRGLFTSAAAGDPNQVTIATYVADMRAWIAAARKETGAECVWLAGHSEGGIVALASANEPGVCGIVLLAAPGRKLGIAIREQLRSNPANAPLLGQADAALTELEAGRKVDTAGMHPALARGLFNSASQDFLIDLLRHDPAAMVKGTRLPVLVVQGGRDLQVAQADADALSTARPGVVRADFPAMNHVLKDAPEDRAGNFLAYAETARPLTTGLADRIAAFVAAQPR